MFKTVTWMGFLRVSVARERYTHCREEGFGLRLEPIWCVSDQDQVPAPGSIYVFLPNGTLRETWCAETYRYMVRGPVRREIAACARRPPARVLRIAGRRHPRRSTCEVRSCDRRKSTMSHSQRQRGNSSVRIFASSAGENVVPLLVAGEWHAQ